MYSTGIAYISTLLCSKSLNLFLLFICIQLLIMCHQHFHTPWSLTCRHIEWRACVEDSISMSAHVIISYMNDLLRELQRHMLGSFGALEQMLVESSLLHHSRVSSVSCRPSLLVVVIAVYDV